MKTNFAARLGSLSILSVCVLAGQTWLNAESLWPQVLRDGKVRVSFVGEIGANYALDRSFSLTAVNWVPQGTNIAGAGGVLLFTNAPDPTTNNFWRVRSLPYDTNAAAYAAAVGLTDLDSIGRVNGFILALKGYGLWTGMDGILLRANFNNGVLLSLAGNYATNYGGVTVDGAGAHYDGATGYTIVPAAISATNTVIFIYAGDTNATSQTQTPFGLFNLAGTNTGAIYPFGMSGEYGRYRWAISGNGTGESTPWQSGCYWLFTLWGDTPCNYGRNVTLWPQDPFLHVWSLGWDNAGDMTSWVDGVYSGDSSGFTTRLLPNALNTIVLGARLNAVGAAVGFAKVHVQAAFVWPRVLSTNEVVALQTAVQWLLPGDERKILIGDSQTAWNGLVASLPRGLWPAALWGMGELGSDLGTPFYSDFAVFDFAVSGITALNFDNSSKLYDRVNPYTVGGPIKQTAAYVWLGINDIGGGATGATTFLHVSNVWNYCRAFTGARITAFTLPSVGSSAVTNYGVGFYANTVERSNFNALVRAAKSQWNELIDLDLAFPQGSMETSQHNTDDGLHFNQIGNSNVARQFSPSDLGN